MTFDDLPIGTQFVNDRELELFETGWGAILTKVSDKEYSHTIWGSLRTFKYYDYYNKDLEVYPVLHKEKPV